MDMSSGNMDNDYTSEIMSAGWNPDVVTMQGEAAELAAQLIHHQSQRASGMPAEVAAKDIEAFLERMYASQQ
jgi:hypothetical protein